MLWRIALRRRESKLSRFALAVFAYGVVHQIAAIMVLGSPALIRLTPMQPMRFLQLIYVFMVLIGGCLLCKHLLKANTLRWAIFLILINAGMFASQRTLFRGSPHLELPGTHSNNPWLESFAWIRNNTPVDAYFAMDPNYLAAPGEDYHSFRALAERSQLADMVKDPAVVTQVPTRPRLGSPGQCDRQLEHFDLKDFQRLKADFGVDWALVSYPSTPGLQCKWHNAHLAVCAIP